ncbi:MAG: pyrimidine reductase family protein [Corynebacterium sp.]|nr:pyrimidine reductase family protein [Corynebacterium sp.]
MGDITEQLIGPVLPVGEPELRTVLVTTIAGSTSTGGTSGHLGNDTDTALLLGLREWADVVLVGSATVKAEDYGGVLINDSGQHDRRVRGQQPVPPIAVMSSSLNFDTTTRFFTEATTAPIIITNNTDHTRLAALKATGAHLIHVDGMGVQVVVDKLRAGGYARISCEGGASVYAQVVDAGLVDVWHHTLDPSLSGTVEKPVVRGGSPKRVPMRLEHSHLDTDSTLFLRYRRS